MIIGEFFAVLLVIFGIWYIGSAIIHRPKIDKADKQALLTATKQRDSLEAALYRIRDNPDNALLEVSIALDELNASRYRELEN